MNNINTEHTEIDEEYLDKALAQCRGDYQRDLIRGKKPWSGSDITGKAARYNDIYKRSRLNLKARLEKIGLPVRIEKRTHNKLILTIKKENQ